MYTRDPANGDPAWREMLHTERKTYGCQVKLSQLPHRVRLKDFWDVSQCLNTNQWILAQRTPDQYHFQQKRSHCNQSWMHRLDSRSRWLFPWECRWRAGAWGVHQSLNRCAVLLNTSLMLNSEPPDSSSQVLKEDWHVEGASTPESQKKTLWSDNPDNSKKGPDLFRISQKGPDLFGMSGKGPDLFGMSGKGPDLFGINSASWSEGLEKPPFLEGFCPFFVLFLAFSLIVCTWHGYFKKKSDLACLFWLQGPLIQSS